ncbi:polysaccharide pyruvyl transferase family protein [Candidatus Saccharibacteria bacterium]|nr:polysaccharide pyruvyl transferase family protein [Candidatus Saccharibacteria bacterium]
MSNLRSGAKKVVKKIARPFVGPVINKVTNRVASVVALQEDARECQERAALSDDIANLKGQLGDIEYEAGNIMYYHGGSGNHGCEALVRTIADICKIKRDDLVVYSYRPEEDKKYHLLDRVAFFKKSELRADELNVSYRAGSIAMSIGGDNYCGYPIPQLAKYNREFHKRGVKTALIGCSIEPDNLNHGEIVGDLCQFDLITARETITYEALKEVGLTKNLHLIPDSAFTLPKESSDLKLRPKTIGINVSSMVSKNDDEDVVYGNIINLVEYIMKNTDYNVALIPHVVQDFNDDLSILKNIFNHFSDTTGRIRLIGTQYNTMQIKDIISQCHMMVAARTHCSIAAYSMNIPTLVLGYSVKSRGIAKDIFGTDENYVKNIHAIKAGDEITESFKWLDKNCAKIKAHLVKTMPRYIKNVQKLGQVYEELKKKSPMKLSEQAMRFKIDGAIVAAKPVRPGEYQKGVVSIITTCYNSENYFFRYLDSILNQTNHKIQLVIVNDGSTDDTEQILLNYVPVLNAKGVEVIYLKQENRGIGAGYDLAIKYLDGEYFCWNDSDDFYASNFIEAALKYFKQNPNHKILRHDGYFVPESEIDSAVGRTDFPLFSISSPDPHEKHLFMNSMLERNFHFGRIFLNTEAFDSVADRNLFHSRAGQQWQMCLPMFYNFESHYIDQSLFYCLVNPNSVSRDVLNNKRKIHNQLGQYEAILNNVVDKMNPKNKKYLMKLIKQKYIVMNLDWAKTNGDEVSIKKYQGLFDKYVADDNIYQKEIDKIDESVNKSKVS